MKNHPNSHSMKAPKILSWIAKRAGIEETLAAKLWHRAVSETELIVGNRDSSDFFRLAIQRLIDLAEEESGHHPITGSNVTWLCHHQARIARLSLVAAENTYRLWQKNWKEFCASGNSQRAA